MIRLQLLKIMRLIPKFVENSQRTYSQTFNFNEHEDLIDSDLKKYWEESIWIFRGTFSSFHSDRSFVHLLTASFAKKKVSISLFFFFCKLQKRKSKKIDKNPIFKSSWWFLKRKVTSWQIIFFKPGKNHHIKIS